jgi:tRNA A-37 threonylcarbamoyl transferase component Bud32
MRLPSSWLASGAMNHGEVLAALARMGLVRPDEQPPIVPLAGGVSSDILRVDLEDGPVCVKRALPRLKVAADWQAPVERNRYEVEWMRIVGGMLPDAVPRILGADPGSGTFAMEFLDPGSHPVWKEQLRDGDIAVETAGNVGHLVSAIHRYTAGDASIAATFATDHIFFSIRLEPYLSATAKKHPDCAGRLDDLVRVTSTTRMALVHGDVSPKNILIGRRGPVLLDAECAWYGDPAFDLSFCLNHLLLKCVWRPHWRLRYLACFDALAAAYLAGVTWEPAHDLESRAARLLPGLLLGRVDGKSPAEYINSEDARDRVRQVARALLLKPVDRLTAVRRAWERT